MPTVTNQNIPLVHRKEWQMMTPAPISAGNGMFVVVDSTEKDNLALYMCSSTVHYLYHHDEDGFVQIPSGAFGGTFGAASCGTRLRWSTTFTASSGSATSLTTTTTLTSLCMGNKIKFLSGNAIGKIAIITGIIINQGVSTTLEFDSLGVSVSATDTFVIDTGRFFILNGGATGATSVKNYDPLLGVWTAHAATGLPASIATDGKLVSTPSNDVYGSGTATGGSVTTLINSAKTWTVNQWANYQLTIVSGPGVGQSRSITSNTSNTITVSSAFTVAITSASVYEITGNDDFIYFLGNNSVVLYRYSLSSNAWTLITPGVARAGAPGVGMSANWIGLTDDPNFAEETNIQNGRYIYSFRGAVTGFLDRYDIALNTWKNITPTGSLETFTTGSSYAISGRFIFIKKDSTHRFFKFNMRGYYLEPLSTNLYPDSTASLGDKLWIKHYAENDVVKLSWLYSLRNNGTELHRLLLI